MIFFPGSSAIYNGIVIVGGLGDSGDGVDQDDIINYFALAGPNATGNAGVGHLVPNPTLPLPNPPNMSPPNLPPDYTEVRGVRLPYYIFPRNPLLY